jgi:phage tail sheath protein FI
VGNAVDLVRDHRWQEKAEIKTGNVYILRRSTEDPVQPDETVLFRWRTPSEFKVKRYVYSRDPQGNLRK